jgi:type II secretion system protein H
MTHRAAQRAAGFTLVEMMVVTALIGLLAVAVVVNVDSFTDRGQLEAAVARIASVSQTARITAQSRGQPVTITYDLDRQVIEWPAGRMALDHGVRIGWVQTKPDERAEQGQVRLTVAPGGLVPGHAVGLVHPRSGCLVCWVCAATGQIKTYKEEDFAFPEGP